MLLTITGIINNKPISTFKEGSEVYLKAQSDFLQDDDAWASDFPFGELEGYYISPNGKVWTGNPYEDGQLVYSPYSNYVVKGE